MKRGLFKKLSKRLAAAAIIGLALFLPASSLAAQKVKMESSLGVANVTQGDTTYKHSVSAKYDEVVKLQVYYHNRENPDSGKDAKNVTVKITIPTATGKTQTVSSKVSADNASTMNSTATINLANTGAYLQYIPGSAVWRHNTGTNKNVKYVNTKISDKVVTSGAGLRLENEKPCYNFAATVTVLARVMVPGITVDKFVSQNGKWVTKSTANPGDVLTYMISYKNAGNTKHEHVVLRDNLPPKTSLVPGTSYLYDAAHPSGVKVEDWVTQKGIDAGSFTPGSNAFIIFKVKLPAADQLACGDTVFTNVGVAHPQGMNEYYNTAETTVNKQCQNPTPAYACTAFDVTKGDNRTVTVKDFAYSVKNGATFKNVVLSWGDSSDNLTTDAKNIIGQGHKYSKDGTYTIDAVVHFTVNGQDKTDTCSKQVSFTSTPTTPTTPSKPTAPKELANTGPGEVVALVVAAIAVGTVASRLFLSRRLARQ